MTPERWARVQALFEQALAQPPADAGGLGRRPRRATRSWPHSCASMLHADETDRGELEDAVGAAIREADRRDRRAARHAHWPLPHRLGDWPGRDGDGLPGGAGRRRVRSAGRDQGGARPARSGSGAAVPRRASDSRLAPAPEHRAPGGRRNHRGRLAVPGHGVRRGPGHRRLRRAARPGCSTSGSPCSSRSAKPSATPTAT